MTRVGAGRRHTLSVLSLHVMHTAIWSASAARTLPCFPLPFALPFRHPFLKPFSRLFFLSPFRNVGTMAGIRGEPIRGECTS